MSHYPANHDIQYGFRFGALEVTRLCSDKEKGWVAVALKTKRMELQLYVTHTGLIRVRNAKTGKAWKEDE